MASPLMPPCQSPGQRDAKIPKADKMSMDLEKDSQNCLLCNNKAGISSRQSISIFGENAITSSEKTILSVLCSTLQTPLIKEKIHSSIMCKKCCKLVNEADELEIKLNKVKEEICNLFKKTSEKFCDSDKKDDVIDHDYVDNIDITNSVSVVKLEKLLDTKKKRKKVTIVEPPEKTNTKNASAAKIVESNKEAKVINEKENKADLENSMSDNDFPDNSNDYSDVEDPDTDLPNNDSTSEVPVDTKSSKKQKDKTDTPKELAIKQDDSYTCVKCNDGVKRDAKTIISHLKMEHEARLYICDVCGDMFSKRTDLSHHLDDHVATEEGDFQCEVCNRIFSNLRLFRIHKRIHYPQIKSWSCENCGKRYSSKNLLDEHMNTHTGNRPYICEVCGKDFASKYTHRAHVKTHEVRSRPFNCTQCEKSFLSQQNLTQHLKTHSGVKDFVCQQCGKAFGSQHNLEVHNIVHTGYKPYICKTCGKAFARKAEIRDHERTHTGEKPYQCEFCGATFSQRSNLQSHKRATHYNDKRYKCDECGKGFKRRRLLDYHIKAAHTGERPYKCDTCTATFVYPEHFKKHMRIHTGEKPYLCEVCGKAFNSRDNRNAHRFIHSDKKPYECLVCGAGFMRKPLLYTHMQTQGHLNDTIVVNQPRLTTEEDVILEDSVHLVMEDDEDQLDEDTQLIVADLKSNQVIIQDGGQHKLISLSGEHVTSSDINQLVIDGQLSFENSNTVNCKQEVSDDVEEVYGYQDDEGNTIVLRPGTDIKDLLSDGSKTMQLVQIRLPSNADAEGRDWLNLVQST